MMQSGLTTLIQSSKPRLSVKNACQITRLGTGKPIQMLIILAAQRKLPTMRRDQPANKSLTFLRLVKNPNASHKQQTM
jgi:hypothetical protein